MGAGMKKTRLDATDVRILSAVQKHGPLSKTKLAELVNLSPTPCWARLDRLKKAGLIRGYRAEIALDPRLRGTFHIQHVNAYDSRLKNWKRSNFPNGKT